MRISINDDVLRIRDHDHNCCSNLSLIDSEVKCVVVYALRLTKTLMPNHKTGFSARN